MTLREALIKAKAENAMAVLDCSSSEAKQVGLYVRVEVVPFVGRTGAHPDRYTFNDYHRTFNAGDSIGDSEIFSWEELVSEDWEVKPK